MKKKEIGFQLCKQDGKIKLVSSEKVAEIDEIICPEMVFRGKASALDFVDNNRHYFASVMGKDFSIEEREYKVKDGYSKRFYR